MAKSNKNSHALQAQKRERALWSHMWQVGCSSERRYLKWCAENGFTETTNKSPIDLKRELKTYRERQVRTHLRESRIDRNPVAVIQAVCARQLEPSAIHSLPLREACECIPLAEKSARERRSLAGFLTELLAATQLPVESERHQRDQVSYMVALVAMHRLRHRWIRPVAEWKPRSRSRRRQFASLVQHLFARYPTPDFFDDVWFRRDGLASKYQAWFVEVAQGKSLRDGPLPVPLTKKATHFLAQAPAEFCVEHAVRFAQIRALGGSLALTRNIVATRLGERFDHDAFWQSVLRFFIAHPELKLDQVGPIIDFLQYHKFEHQEFFLDDGTTRLQPPLQPNLSMHRRTLPTLLAQVDLWHRRLGKIKALAGLRWSVSGIDPAQFICGKGSKQVTWRIVELLSHKELVREGSAQQHCVATYARECRSGFCSIWSMISEDAGGNVRRRQTIQVARNRCIVQCRGRMNRRPSEVEAQIVRRWAKVASLDIAAAAF